MSNFTRFCAVPNCKNRSDKQHDIPYHNLKTGRFSLAFEFADMCFPEGQITRLQCMDNYCYSGMQRDMGTLP